MAMLETVGFLVERSRMAIICIRGGGCLIRWACSPVVIGSVCGMRCVQTVWARLMWPYGCVMAWRASRCTGVLPIREAVSMTVNRKLYPPKTVWEAMRRERLEQVGFQCELCGLPDATE